VLKRTGAPFLHISKDRTIWLAHTADLPDCGGISYDCFPESADDQIINLDSCNGKGLNYTRLEEIFAYLSSNFPDKYISLDVKAWEPCAVTSVGIIGVMNVIADEIIRLTEKYNLQNHVMVESETATFLNYIRRRSTGIGIYLVSLGDFERAMQLSLESGFTGISFKYNFDEMIGEEHIQLIRRKGLKIQLWTVNTEENIIEALSINPDFIQTDNINYFEQHK
jgi:glycerophosphoryl diester phosphodiesterase